MQREMLRSQSPPSSVSQFLDKMSPPPVSPMGPLQREMYISRALFYMSSQVPSKQGFLIKQNFTFPSKSLVKEPPLCGHPTEGAAPFPEPMVTFHLGLGRP